MTAGGVRRVTARLAWRELPPASERVVIPGGGRLRDVSRAEEAAVGEARFRMSCSWWL